MDYYIDNMTPEDWEEVAKVYLEGINTGVATFQTVVPSWEEWNNCHIKPCRLVVRSGSKILGWSALSATSSRCVYAGVAEVSIYIGIESRGKGIGTTLLNNMIKDSEEEGFWTLQSGIMKENAASIALHKNCGFRQIGFKEKVGRTSNGEWHDVVLMERRSKIIGVN